MAIAELGVKVTSTGLDKTNRGLDTLSRGAKAATVAVAGLAAAALSIGQVVRIVKEFETSMSQVAAVTRATNSELKSLRDTAKSLGSTTEFSAAQAADGLKFLGMAGLDAAESIEAIPAVLDLATASSMGLARSADITSNVLSGFGLAASEAATVADVLAAASSRANTDVSQLGQAMSTVAPISAALGVDLADTAAAIGALSDAGIQGERAGTALRGVLASLAGPTDQAAKALRNYGLTVDQVNPETVALADIFGILSSRGLSTADAMTIFGREAASGALVLTGAADRVGEFGDELRNAGGAANDMATIMRDNLAGSANSAMSALEGLAIAIGEAGLTAVLRAGLDLVAALARGLTKIVNVAGDVISFFTSFGTFEATLNKVQAASDLTNLAIADMLAQVNAVSVAEMGGRQVSLDYANAKLEQARASYAAADAVRAERIEQIKASDEYQALIAKQAKLNESISMMQDILSDSPSQEALDMMEFMRDPTDPNNLDGFVVQLQRSLEKLRETVAQQDALTGTVGETSDAQKEALRQIEMYEAAIAAAKDGVVTLGAETSDAADTTAALARLAGDVDFSDAVTDAALLATNLGIALNEAISLRNLQNSLEYSGRGGDPRQFMRETGEAAYTMEQGYVSVTERIEQFRKSQAKATGGSKSATKQLEKELKALKASLDPIEKYNQEMSRLVKFKGLLTEAQYDEGIRRLNEELLDSIPLVGDLSDAFTDDLFGGFKDGLSSTLDVFKNWLKQLAAEAIRNQIFIPITAGLTGGGVAGTVASAAGGGGGALGGIGNILGIGSKISGFAGGIGTGLSAALGTGGFASAGLFNVGANAAAATAAGAGGIAASIGAALPVLGAVAAAVSFFSSKTKHLDNGLRVTADNMGVLVEEFNKVEKSRFWGLSKKIKLTFDEASEETAAPIRKSINDITTSIGMAGEQLGLTADNFSSWSTQIQVSLKGLDEAAKNAEIQRIFDTVAEQFSYAALGHFNEVLGGTLIREGETAAETMDALVVSLAAANGAFRLVNQTMFEASVIGADMARQLVDAAGGVDSFNSAFNSYFSTFYSQEEQLSMRTQRLARTMSDFGVELPQTNAQFRDLVEAQDLTTEAGRNTYAQLLLVSGEFAQLTALSEQLYGAASLAATGVSALIRSLASAVTEADAALESAKQAAIAEYNNVMRIIDAQMNAARQAAQAAYRNALSIMDQQISEAESARDAIRNIFDILHDGLRERSLLDEGAQMVRRSQLQAELAGGISDPNRLRDVIEGLNEPSEKLFGSFEEYARDYYRTSNIIDRQKDLAEDQLSEAEMQIELLEDQKRLIEDQYGPLVGIEKNTADLDQAIKDIVENAEELALLEEQKQAIQDMYGPLLGIDENTDDLDAALARLEEAMRDVEAATNRVEDAIGALAAALIQMVSGIRGTQGLAALGADAFSVFSNDNTNAIFSDMATGVMDDVAAQINQLYNNVLGRNVDVAGLDYYGSRLQSGEASLGRIDYALRTSGEALDGDTPGFGNIGAGGGGQDPVEALYGAMLGTQPDPAGVEFWKSTGLKGEALINAFRDGALANGQVPSFSGGGYTGNGARFGGLDGQGGMLAMLHPRETVIDHHKGQVFSAPSRSNNDNKELREELVKTNQYMKELVKINNKQERTLKEIEFQGEAA